MKKLIPQVTINLCRNVGVTPARFLTREDISQIYPDSTIVSSALWQLIQAAQQASTAQGIISVGPRRRCPKNVSSRTTVGLSR